MRPGRRLFCEAVLDMYDPGRARLDAALLELELVPPPAREGEYSRVSGREKSKGGGRGRHRPLPSPS